ncbi:uncharacterized protein [Nicotiana sylvestris]|uniref:uncharacterized protein n=1 Tax=Nicotiana sylvestris TaxID=4096 RepID=UPI00388CB2D2
MEKDTIELDRYHAGHVYFDPSWLEDNIAGIFEPRVGQGNRVVDEVAEAQVKYERLRKWVLESEAKHLEQHKFDMESINEWKEMATRSAERLEYLEQGLMKLEVKMRKRVVDCQNPDVELPKDYKPHKFEMFDGMGDPKVHLRTYCDKLVGVGKDERIHMKLFMRSLTGDVCLGISVRIPRSGFNIDSAPDVFYIQNLKKKPTETFREYATRWRSKATKVRPTLEEEQMSKFFVRAQDPQYYERLMVIKNHKFSDIIKLGERIKEGIKSGMVTNFEALQATNKALQFKSIGYVTPIPAVAMENSSQWVNPNKTCAYHSGMKGHTIDECHTLKDKIQTLIDTKVIQAKEATPNVRNNPLPDHRGEGVNMIETNEECDPEGSIGLIQDGDDPKPAVTLTPIMVQIQLPVEVEVATSVSFEIKAITPVTTPALFEVEISTPFTVTIAPTPPFKSNAIPWDYVAEARRKGKEKMDKSSATQGMTRTGRIYIPENLGGTRNEAATKQPIIETGLDNLWRKVQISIMSLLQNSEVHRSALMKLLNEAYVPNNITSGEMANMVGQVLERDKLTSHEDELPPKGLSYNMALHITVQFEDKFITKVLIDRGLSLNICPLTTLKRLGKYFHEIREGSMNVTAFDGSQRATIGEINLYLQIDLAWFDVEFQEVIIHGDGSNPIYTSQIVPVVENRRRLGGETYHRIERVNAIEKDKWWSNKIESILAWSGYEPGKGLGKKL